MHNLIFDARGRSYRELPLRLFEFGTVYRYEKSGVVHGLTRARGFTQDDAHIYCTREQMSEELDKTLTFVLGLLRDYGLTDFYLELSTKDPEKFVGSDEAWEEATETLRQVAEKQGLPLVPDPGGAAFYGPKISVQAKDAIGRTWQMSTIQLDFNLPERFDLEYTGRRRLQAAPGHDPPRAVRLDRAVLRGAPGALRGRLPGVAGPGPGGRHPDRRRARRVPGEVRRGGARRRACGSRWTPPPTGCRRRSATPRSRRCRSWSSRATRTWPTDAVSFRYRDGSQENGIPFDEAIAKIATGGRGAGAGLIRPRSRGPREVQPSGGLSSLLAGEDLQQPGGERSRHRAEQGQPAGHHRRPRSTRPPVVTGATSP